MKIDAHQHFWQYNSTRDQWIDESMNVLKRDFLPADLESRLSENNFDGCIAVQADQSEEETEFLLRLAEENGFIKGVVGWIDLKNPYIEERLDYFSRYKKLKGFRHIVQAEPVGFMLQKDFQRGIKALRDYNYCYDILVCAGQLPETIELVKKFPDQLFVLDHLGKPNIRDNQYDFWHKHISELARASNIYSKISGMVTEAEWFSWGKDDFRPYLDQIFTSFGVDRLMFGSDWPVCLLSARYSEVVSLITSYLDQFSATDRAKVMGENAQRFYQI